MQALITQRKNRRRRSITCWGVVNQGISEVTAPETLRKIAAPSAGEFKESSDEKPNRQDIAPFHPTTKRYWALWDSLHLRNGVSYRKWESDDGKKHSGGN
ncbi:hypothetical protein TNCV_3552821 [Trichonephila clavipes]|nr:hypothetical protein TNCV_3552821 [Trichonephila clavipes]